MPDRTDLHQRWLTLLTDERARRSGLPSIEEAQAWLVETLDRMAKRIVGAPDYRPPTPAEAAANSREIEAFFAKRG